ncbi:hypothetical protein AB0465_37505 [Streptomyces griseoviridis]|uniref:hypothetical protein n=1 Tax=Streptomyces griseoviridis TaxID=45398 RepID=UPI0033EDB461
MTVTETTHLSVTDPARLIHHGYQLARADPTRAAQHGWTPGTPMTAEHALGLLLADTDVAEISAFASDYGLALSGVQTLATRTDSDTTVYESGTG